MFVKSAVKKGMPQGGLLTSKSHQWVPCYWQHLATQDFNTSAFYERSTESLRFPLWCLLQNLSLEAGLVSVLCVCVFLLGQITYYGNISKAFIRIDGGWNRPFHGLLRHLGWEHFSSDALNKVQIRTNKPVHSLWRHLGRGANTAKITVNVWDFGPVGTAITRVQRGGFPTFATTLNSFTDIVHSTENKAMKEGTTSVNSNYKSSRVASNFMVICVMLIRRICMKS